MPYEWALAQLHVAEAHTFTRGTPDVTVAIIDMGYSRHPDHEGHLWVNPNPTRGDIDGWDFDDNDASLEHVPTPDEPATSPRRHHQSFLTGEVIGVAPGCRIMLLRCGDTLHNLGGWTEAINYAVDHGAKVIVIPTLYHARDLKTGISLWHQGTDWQYPLENVQVIQALDRAYEAGCLIFRGVADNRHRRSAQPQAAVEAVIPVGSTNRFDEAANICPDSDTTEIAAPGGQRATGDPRDVIWGTGADGGYVEFTGGCMASAFAGGVAALAMSQYPQLTNGQIRQILRNTARGQWWGPRLGHGILNAAAAVSLTPAQLRPGLRIDASGARLSREDGRLVLDVPVENTCVFDLRRVLAIAYDGDPTVGVDTSATTYIGRILLTQQLGHAIAPATGLERATVRITLGTDTIPEALWVQASALDVGAAGAVATARLPLPPVVGSHNG